MATTITDRVYGITSGVAIKAPVKVATTAEITLSGAQTIDGVAVVADDRVLVKNQTDQTTNGIYNVSNSTWERAKDFDGTFDAVTGSLVFVISGSANSGLIYKLTTSGEVVFGTSNITFANSGIGTSAFLTSLAALGTAADKYIYTTGAGVAAEGDITSLARNLLDDSTTSAMQTTLGGGATGRSLFTSATSAAAQSVLGLANPFVCDFRLTLTSGTPVTTSDVTAATTLYCTPYKGNYISLYDGSAAWTTFESAQMSIAVPATTSTIYDVFCYDNSGTPALELTAWTNDTTRATAITPQDGVYVKSGATDRRYLGSFRTTGVSGQTEDSITKRYLWNYYNRIKRSMQKADTTTSWTYSTSSFRQANNSTANQLDFVVGVSEDSVTADVCVGPCFSSTLTLRNIAVGIGLDSTSVNSATVGMHAQISNAFEGFPTARYEGFPGVGRHYLAWLERGAGADTQTWYGALTGSIGSNSGISGSVLG